MINELQYIKEKLEEAYKVKDVKDIDDDINKGKILLKYGTVEQKNEYINTINKKYGFYFFIISEVMNLRVKRFGPFSTRIMNIDEKISNGIDVLSMIKSEKLYEELVKILDNTNEKFKGGINIE